MTADRRPPTDDWHEYTSDASNTPGGHAAGVVFPRTVEEIVDILTSSDAVLPIGAQSSLTGGATPMGELILSTSKMARIVEVTPQRITVEPGVTVAAMQEALAEVGAWFPPAPTFAGASAGGIVATNAAGAATFKYGSTRNWVEALTIVLADGTIMNLSRGMHRAANGWFRIDTRSGPAHVPVPTYRMPDVAKRSAGYYAARGMDLVDLFIGSEGTLGVTARVTFRVASPAPEVALALVPCPGEQTGLTLVRELRLASQATWRTGDPQGIDVAAVEHLDHRSIEILREDGADVRHRITFPGDTVLALIVQLELAAGTDQETAYREIQTALDAGTQPAPLVRFCRTLDLLGLLDDTELVLPGHARRSGDVAAIREAVPAGVNQRVSSARQKIDPRIEKTAADMIVPFERFAEMMDVYRRGFESRALDYAMWGHISDGNVHPNVIPTSYDDVIRGRQAILEFGEAATRLGGCPLAEHGVGRNRVKQTLLANLYGETGIDEMRAVKRALDPRWKLAPGVIFER